MKNKEKEVKKNGKICTEKLRHLH